MHFIALAILFFYIACAFIDTFKLLKSYKKSNLRVYYLSKHWRKIRKEVLVRDDYRCQICNSNKELQVHHLHYENNLENTKHYQLITVCSKCHKQLHKKRK